jgi:hypothetical protein
MKLKMIGLVLGLAFLVGANAEAGPLVLDAGWIEDTFFDFGPTEETLLGSYIFDLAGPALLTITDCCVPGDAFDLYDGAAFLASSAPLAGVPFGDGLGEFPFVFDADLADPAYDGLQYMLAPGSYSLSIEMTDISGGTPGSLGVRLDSKVPEPSTLALLGAALLGLAVRRRR